MPETNDPKRKFIHEKVVKPRPTKKQRVMKAVCTLSSAVAFGVIAAISFQVTLDNFKEEETIAVPTVSIPKDEPVETSTAETQMETEVVETEAIEEVVQSAMEEYQLSRDGVVALSRSLKDIVDRAGASIVEVRSVQSETDWFDNTVETSGAHSGIVIADTSHEILVLVPETAVEHAESIQVKLPSGDSFTGILKGLDSVGKIAIVAIDKTLMGEELQDSIEPIELGNSHMAKQSEVVIAVGSPAGAIRSTDYGIISYVQKNISVVDGVNHILYSKVAADAMKGTYLINLDGELVGWAVENEEESQNQFQRFVGVSDYKSILEKLVNGHSLSIVGIIGKEVPQELIEQGFPSGIYVVTAVQGRPAYEEGIQSGDVIVAIGETTIRTMSDYQNLVDSLAVGEEIVVKVLRNGREQYMEVDFQLIVQER